MTSPTPDLIKLDVESSSKLVHEVATKLDALINEEIFKLVESSRFVIKGRILNTMFASFYSMSLKAADEAIKREPNVPVA